MSASTNPQTKISLSLYEILAFVLPSRAQADFYVPPWDIFPSTSQSEEKTVKNPVHHQGFVFPTSWSYSSQDSSEAVFQLRLQRRSIQLLEGKALANAQCGVLADWHQESRWLFLEQRTLQSFWGWTRLYMTGFTFLLVRIARGEQKLNQLSSEELMKLPTRWWKTLFLHN